MVNVQIINKPDAAITGTSRYITELQRGLHGCGDNVTVSAPVLPGALRFPAQIAQAFGVDLKTFFTSYPLAIEHQSDTDLIHIPTQTMATLLRWRRIEQPVVVTVLDIIPYLVQDDPVLNSFGHGLDRRLYQIALEGLHHADALIAISEYTKRTVVETQGIAADKIRVIYLGVDQARFRHQAPPPDFYARYGIDPARRYLLYVGSEDPRKNLDTLLHALAIVHRHEDMHLLKVGRPHFTAQREHLRALAHTLKLDAAVCFYDDVPDDDLAVFYNAASLLVMPSFYEGFGFPVVEAMACGTPVVIADASSLPELGGTVARRFNPHSADDLAGAILDVVANPGDPAQWQAQAARFNWANTVQQTRSLYEDILRGDYVRYSRNR